MRKLKKKIAKFKDNFPLVFTSIFKNLFLVFNFKFNNYIYLGI